MPEWADVLRWYGRAYRDRFGADLRPSHRRAMDALLHCRTEAWGGQRLQGERCGQGHDVDHACRHRSCPQCHHQDPEAWLEERRQERLPVPSFHGVFTLPRARRPRGRRNRPARYAIVRRAAAQALLTLAAAPHYVGARIGGLGVLHAWPRALADHPHVHGRGPAGGVAPARSQWRPGRTSDLVPVDALSKLLRGLVVDLVRQERPALTRPEGRWTTGWGVYGKPTVHGPEQVLNDLGRHVHRIALTTSRMLALEAGHGCCRSQEAQDQRWQPMPRPAHEFMRRFLPQVLPQGCHTVRSDGLWSPVPRPLRHHRQRWLAGHAPAPPPASPDPASHRTASWCPPLQAGHPCPSGGQGLLVVIRRRPRHWRAPP
jgi:Putative transposase/Transposase zinc-binding domain